MRFPGIRYFVIFCTAYLLAAPRILAEPALVPEYGVKAAYVYNIVKLIRFPSEDEILPKNFVICLAVGDEVKDFFAPIDGKLVRGRKLEIRKLQAEDNLNSCQVLFVSNNAPRVPEFSSIKSLVSIGEDEGFCKGGGMFRFQTISSQVKLNLNTNRLEESGVILDSALKDLTTPCR